MRRVTKWVFDQTLKGTTILELKREARQEADVTLTLQGQDQID